MVDRSEQQIQELASKAIDTALASTREQAATNELLRVVSGDLKELLKIFRNGIKTEIVKGVKEGLEPVLNSFEEKVGENAEAVKGVTTTLVSHRRWLGIIEVTLISLSGGVIGTLLGFLIDMWAQLHQLLHTVVK